MTTLKDALTQSLKTEHRGIGNQKFAVGPFQGWLVGPQQWEVRFIGRVVGNARNMSDCCRIAERLNREYKETH